MSKNKNNEELTIDEDVDTDLKKSDFVKISSDTLSCLNIKVAFFLLLVGMVIFSDVFIDNILSKIPSTIEGELTTTKGTMIQLMIFIILYLLLDLIVQKKWL
jgi:hypothetical protein